MGSKATFERRENTMGFRRKKAKTAAQPRAEGL
jgi:hypothetical protein